MREGPSVLHAGVRPLEHRPGRPLGPEHHPAPARAVPPAAPGQGVHGESEHDIPISLQAPGACFSFLFRFSLSFFVLFFHPVVWMVRIFLFLIFFSSFSFFFSCRLGWFAFFFFNILLNNWLVIVFCFRVQFVQSPRVYETRFDDHPSRGPPTPGLMELPFVVLVSPRVPSLTGILILEGVFCFVLRKQSRTT